VSCSDRGSGQEVFVSDGPPLLDMSGNTAHHGRKRQSTGTRCLPGFSATGLFLPCLPPSNLPACLVVHLPSDGPAPLKMASRSPDPMTAAAWAFFLPPSHCVGHPRRAVRGLPLRQDSSHYFPGRALAACRGCARSGLPSMACSPFQAPPSLPSKLRASGSRRNPWGPNLSLRFLSRPEEREAREREPTPWTFLANTPYGYGCGLSTWKPAARRRVFGTRSLAETPALWLEMPRGRRTRRKTRGTRPPRPAMSWVPQLFASPAR
jgi:hypothetical protein